MIQLIEEFFRKFGRSGGDEDAVEAIPWDAELFPWWKDARIHERIFLKIFLSECDKLRQYLDSGHIPGIADHSSKNRSRPSRPRPDIEDDIPRFRIQEFDHKSDCCRLGNGLTETDGERIILVWFFSVIFRHEIGSIDLSERSNDLRCFKCTGSYEVLDELFLVGYEHFADDEK